jgi:hypothetical protein
MSAMTTVAEQKVCKLLGVLDNDIEHIQCTLSQLNELRALVIKRDERALKELLEAIRVEAECYTANELKRQSMRKDLSNLFDCCVEDVTLSYLIDVLPAETSAQIAEKKVALRALVERLKKEYAATVLLLSECARFNNILFRSIFDLGEAAAITYGSNGEAKRQSNVGLVDMAF